MSTVLFFLSDAVVSFFTLSDTSSSVELFVSDVHALDSISATMSFFLGLYFSVKLYLCSLSNMHCNVGGAEHSFFFTICSNGRWSFSTSKYY